jgi:glycosyltransferase involved in cell wall biosynthesis
VPTNCELTILMPCLNEAETLATCIDKAQGYLTHREINGEVLVADNGSTDGSQEIARRHGARVVDVPNKGYGNALLGGIQAARGTYVIMGDADDSYDFSNLDAFVQRLRAGDDLVMGNRFRGGIAPGAMPALHRYLGNPVLSFIGRLFFHAPVRDFHCGLRGFRRDAILALGLRTTGMEFASELVVKACLSGLRISEVPTTLRKDGRSRPPHLRSWRDGWRHLRFLLIYSPRWLFLYPGLIATSVGLFVVLILMIDTVTIGGVSFAAGTMVYASALASLGYQSMLFGVLTKLYAQNEGFLPSSPRFRALAERVSVERGLVLGLLILLLGLAVAASQVIRWGDAGFGNLDADQTIRVAIPASLGLLIGFETILSSMFIGILSIRTTSAPPAIRVREPEQSPTGAAS